MITLDRKLYTWYRCKVGHLVLVAENDRRWRTIDRGVIHHRSGGCQASWEAIAPELAATLTSAYLIGGPEAARLLWHDLDHRRLP